MSCAQDIEEIIKSGLGLVLFHYQGGPIDLKHANVITSSPRVRVQLEKLGVSVPLVEPMHTGALLGHSAFERGETQITDLQKAISAVEYPRQPPTGK
jgi:hypothetical protein